MAEQILYRQLTSIEELVEVQELEKIVWEMEPIPIHQTLTAIKNGGSMIGAYDGLKLVGFTYGFPGFKDNQVYLCSHMMGIHPEYRGKGIGDTLKRLQRGRSLESGYKLITWTFDPLESVNAYLNTHKLKGIAARYIENNYGSMNDSLNYGLPTDRFTVEWWIDSGHVKRENNLTNEVIFSEDKVLLKTTLNNNGLPYAEKTNQIGTEVFNEKEEYFVPIPVDFQHMKKEDLQLAIDWRLKTRKVFLQLLAQGFVGIDVVRFSKEISYYVFVHKSRLDF